MKKIIITGGAGFIGSCLTNRFLKSGSTVLVIDNLSFGNRNLLPIGRPNLTFCQADVRKEAEVTQLFSDFKPEEVVHLAALHYIPYCNEHPEETVETNINGTRNVLRACREHLPRKIFIASTAAVYAPKDEPFTEEDEVTAGDLYSSTKLACEELAGLFHYKTGTTAVIGRIFNVYGPNETNPHLIPSILEQLQQGIHEIKLGNLSSRRDYIFVEDLASAIESSLAQIAGGLEIFNLGSSVPHSVEDVVQTMSELLNIDIRIRRDETRMRAHDPSCLTADISKIRAATGWKPTHSLRSGLEKLIRSEHANLICH